MAFVPGAPGNQLFGIGIFVTAGFVPDVTLPLYWGVEAGENVVRQERVVYDQTSTPVFITPTPSVPLAYATRETQAVLRRRIYDPTATPVIVPPTQTPSAFGYQTVDAAVLRKRKVLPDGVAVPLTPPAVITPVLPADTSARTRRKISLPDGYAEPVTIPTAVAAPPVFSGSQQVTAITRRVVYDPGAARPPVPPVVVTVAVTFVPDAPQNDRVRSRVKPIPLSAFVFAYPVNDFAADYSDQLIRPKRKVLPDGMAQPPVQPVIPPALGTLASAHGTTTAVLSRVVYDTSAARPLNPPVVLISATPANLFDNIGPVKVTPPNRTAIRIDLQGVVWPPQDPADLTGVVTPPVEPPVVTEPPGGAGDIVRRGVYKKYKLRKKLKRDECEELLAYLRSLPPAERQVEIEELADRPWIASLLEMMPVAAPVQTPAKPADDDDDDECIALLLQILNS